jgi:hypothetical protein
MVIFFNIHRTNKKKKEEKHEDVKDEFTDFHFLLCFVVLATPTLKNLLMVSFLKQPSPYYAVPKIVLPI